MSNVTTEQCDDRIAKVHAKLDRIITSQNELAVQVAQIEVKVSGNSGFISNLVTIVVASVTAYVTGVLRG